MKTLPIPLLVWLTLLLSGCDASTERKTGPSPGTGAVSTAGPAGATATVDGTYRVSGTTVERDGGASRRIDGTIVLVQEGGRYRASFQLQTLYPTPGGDHQAVVIGKGEGSVAGTKLDGTAQTQVVIAAVPGVDTEFAFAPRAVTTRIESSARGSIGPDGKLVIEIENAPAPGAQYRPTHTKLTGDRIRIASASPPTP